MEVGSKSTDSFNGYTSKRQEMIYFEKKARNGQIALQG